MEGLFLLQQPLAWGWQDTSEPLLIQSAPSFWFVTRAQISLGVVVCPAPWWCFPILQPSMQMARSWPAGRWGALGSAFLFAGLLLSAQKQVMSWTLSSHGYQWPETAEPKMERGPRGHLGPWWPCGSATQVRTADLYFSQTCFKSCCKGLVTGSWEQVLTDPGFLWLTPILLWGQMASLLF